MTDQRLVSLAAGVTPELNEDPASFVSAAAAAGWSATGIWFDPGTWTAHTTSDLRQRLADTGLTALDMEVIRMGTDMDCGEALIDAAGELGVQNVLTVSSFEDPAQTADRFAALCERAAPAGIRVCIEFMRFTRVRTLADALQIVALAGQPNAGILVDLLHVVRSGTTFNEIADVDPALFPYVQWCDGPREPGGWERGDLIIDALDDRAVPGAGQLAVGEFEQLFSTDTPFSLEVRSKQLRQNYPDPTERAKHVLAATRRALAS